MSDLDLDLEHRYRLLLLAFPRRYRERRGEEMLGTLMDSAHPGQRWPSAADAADLVTGGLRTRTGLSETAGSGRVLAIAAPTGLSLAAGLSLVALVFGELGGRPGHQPRWDIYSFGPFTTPGVVIYLLVLGALAGFSAGRVGLARLGALLAVVADVVCYAEAGPQRWGRPNLTLLVCLGLCLVPLLLAPMARPAHRIRLQVGAGAVLLLSLGAVSFGRLGPRAWMSTGEAFYRSPEGLVSVWSPDAPVFVALTLVVAAVCSLVQRRPEVWFAGTLVLVPAIAFVYGGRFAHDRLPMLALVLTSGFIVLLPAMALRLRKDRASA